jgi:hypothetical protein
MWRDNPQLNAVVEWIDRSAARDFLRDFGDTHAVALVAVQTIHILGICLVVAAAWLTGLWLLGAAPLPRALGASPRVLVRWMYPTLGVMAATGLLLIVRRPDRILLSAAFPIKLALIALGLALMVGLSRSLRHDMLYWERTPGRRLAGRGLGLCIVAVWSTVVFAGRWIPFS